MASDPPLPSEPVAAGGSPTGGGSRPGFRVRAIQALLRRRDALLGRTRLIGALFAIATGLLIWPGLGLDPPLYEVGEIAARTVSATEDFTYEDEAATEERRREAVELVPDVFDFDAQVREEARLRIARSFEFGRAALGAGIVEEPDFPQTLDRTMGVPVASSSLDLLVETEFAEEVQQNLADAVTSVLARDILAERGALAALGRQIQRRDPQGGGSTVIADFSNVLSLDEARRAVELQILAISELDTPRRRALAALAATLVRPTLLRNEVETTHLRSAAEEAVDPVVIQVRRGRTIVRAGDEVTPLAGHLLQAMRAPSDGASAWAGLGAMAFSLLLAILLGILLAPAREEPRWQAHAFALAGAAILIHLVANRGAGFLGRAVAAQLVAEPFSDPGVYVWAVPVASVALLTSALENQASALATHTLFAVALTVMTGDLELGLFALLTGCAGIVFYFHSERRAHLLRVGARIGFVGAGVIVALTLIRGGDGGLTRVVLEAGSAFAGGLLATPVVTVLLPLFELVFERTSEQRLMELARRDNPVLRQLALRAPGTYQHSVLVGLLSEEAADAVGANSTYCAAAALYHDIGKLSRSNYFVENFRGGSPHDELLPVQSAAIIRGHVTEGIRTGRNLGLPKDVLDIIPQHHGTRLIRFFYEKARKAAEARGETVDEDAYRYNGPRPQTREAAIIMIADSVEAAARSVEEPTREKFERVVDRILESVVEDGQLVECDITLRDMNRIRHSLLSTLLSIHHKRLSYPGFDFGRPRGG